MSKVVATVSLILVLFVGCSKRSTRDDTRFDNLETEDVDAAVDAGLTTTDDEQAPDRGPEVAGVLPEGFPPDAPLFTPSNLVDFGELGGGRYFVDFDTMAPLADVQRTLTARLATNGWVPTTSGEYTKSPYRIRVEFSDMSPGTRIRYEFGI